MAVPAHDTRDFEFAQQFKLLIVAVVDPGTASGQWPVASGQCATQAVGTPRLPPPAPHPPPPLSTPRRVYRRRRGNQLRAR